MSIRSRLLVVMLGIACSLGVVALVSVHSDRSIRNIINGLAEDTAPTLRLLHDIDAKASKLLDVLVLTVSSSSERSSPDSEKSERELVETSDSLLSAFEEFERDLVGAEKNHPLVLELKTQCTLLATTSYHFLRTHSQDIRSLEKVVTTRKRLSEAITSLINIEKLELAQKEKKATTLLRHTRRFRDVVLVGMIVLSILFSWYLAEQIVRPIRVLQRATRRIATGGLKERVVIDSSDEIGELADSFNAMAEALEVTTVSKHSVERIIESMQSALIVTDGQFRVVLANESAKRLFEPKRDDFSSTSVTNLFSPPCPISEEELRREGWITGREVNFVSKSEGSIPLLAAVSPIFDATCTLSGFTIVAQDLRSQRERNAEIDRYRKELSESRQLANIGMMSSILAHRLNQPLTSINLSLQHTLRELSRSSENEEVRDVIDEALEEVRNVRSIVRDVLQLAHPHQEKERAKVSVYDTAEKVLRIVQEEAQLNNVSVELETGNQELTIVSIPEDIEEAFYILLQNGIQAGSEQNSAQQIKLVVSFAEQNGEVLCSFRDNAGGISKSDQKNIFDPFYTTKARKKGTGLGLAILKRIVEDHRGSISLDSTEGVGSTFVLRFPTEESNL